MDVTDPPGSDEFHPSNFAENLEKLKSKIRCRDEEISYVHRLLGQVRLCAVHPLRPFLNIFVIFYFASLSGAHIRTSTDVVHPGRFGHG